MGCIGIRRRAMFTRIRSILVVALAASTLIFNHSSAVEWEVKYDGDVSPDKAPLPWTRAVFGGNKVNVTSKRELHIVDDSKSGYAYFYRPAKSLKTLTLETRVKTESNSDGLAVSLRVSDTSNVAHIFFQQKKIELRSGFAAFPESQFDIDMRDYHVVRVLKEGENIAIYIDGQIRLEGKLGTTSSSAARISFGSYSWSGEGESFWDYVRYTTKGSFSPEGIGKKKLSGKDKLSTRWGDMKRGDSWRVRL